MLECIGSVLKERAELKAATSKSKQINCAIRQHELQQRKRISLLLLGVNTQKTMKSLQRITNGFSEEDRIAWRACILNYVQHALASLSDLLRESDMSETKPIGPRQEYLLDDSSIDELPKVPKKRVAIMVTLLKRLPSSIDLDPSVRLFLSDLHRILDPEYLPSDQDIINLPRGYRPQHHGPHTLRYSLNSLDLLFIDIDGVHGERRKWIHQFDDTPYIIISVDLNTFDPDTPENLFSNEFDLFKSIAESRWFVRSDILLLLTNYAAFRVTLSGLTDFKRISGYEDGGDLGSVLNLILSQFSSACNRKFGTPEIHPFVCELDVVQDATFVQCIADVVLMSKFARPVPCFGWDGVAMEKRVATLPAKFPIF